MRGGIKDIFGIDCNGLHKVDGLILLKSSSGPATEDKKKKLIKIFTDNGLKITV